ncbi:hypothetical protein DAPPUDRAFT_305199 [Daphnia pulex]|uniref:Uncharacterized protein n=1 Tax=Daphnia pulex TaxID=6669 RepID=E9I3M5_DAPPU|nr:hypothetical protein DAPPUDRAFT_305199 [Daphnia pulex]|eukprot:EFX61406.1 hypothetical protein DAPPUDRAFT_305199 [Daphnia pulex]
MCSSVINFFLSHATFRPVALVSLFPRVLQRQHITLPPHESTAMPISCVLAVIVEKLLLFFVNFFL